jgi:hypothetical protein
MSVVLREKSHVRNVDGNCRPRAKSVFGAVTAGGQKSGRQSHVSNAFEIDLETAPHRDGKYRGRTALLVYTLYHPAPPYIFIFGGCGVVGAGSLVRASSVSAAAVMALKCDRSA